MSGTASPRSGGALLADLLRGDPILPLAAAGLATLAAAVELLPYWLVYRMVVEATAAPPRAGALAGFAGLVLAAAVGRLLLFGAANILSHRWAFRIQKELRIALLRALDRQPLGRLQGRAGDLKKTLLDDVGGLEHLVAHTLPDAVAGLAVALLATALLVAVDWRMALASLALLPVAVFAQARAFRGLGAIQAGWHAADAAANAGLLAHVRGIATLKSCNRVASSFDGLRRSVHALAELADRVTRRTAVPYALFFAALSGNLLVVLPTGLVLHAAGRLDAAVLVLFVMLGAGLTAPLLRVVHAFAALGRQMQGAARVAELLDAPPLPSLALPSLALPSPALPSPVILRRPPGAGIRFDQVRFGYGGGPDLFDGLSFDVPEGGVTALVGPSGSGKSTALRLAARFWDVRGGAVRIGGADVREMAPEALRARIAVVFQDPVFFHGTIRENLEIAAPGAPSVRLDHALEAARLDDLLARLPRGLDTPLGDRAVRLSGGERQRLSIARALLKDAPILLLDEATAFADPESECAVQQAVARLTRGRTLLVVAHRLATVVEADAIAVLDQGRLDGVGRHGELLDRSPVYRRLWESQERVRSRREQWSLRA